MKIMQEFKAFAMRGNMIDMAVGIILGAAFGKIVSSLVNDVLMPPLGLLLGGINFSEIKIIMKEAITNPATGKVLKEAVAFNIGIFIQTIIDFIIIAFSIFLMVKGINKLNRSKPAEEPGPSKQETLLSEIRDLLKNK